MESLKIGNLTVRVPIIQGGMGVAVSLAGLASAVANEGGIGIISAAGIGMKEPDYTRNFIESNKIGLRKEIQKAKKGLTWAIIGLLVVLMSYAIVQNILKITLSVDTPTTTNTTTTTTPSTPPATAP